MNTCTIKEITEKLIQSGEVRSSEIQGCSEAEIRSLENDLHIQFPPTYREFLSVMGRSADGFFRGTDMFWPDLRSLRRYAEELLEENGNPFPLSKDAIVIAVHQGYQFLYLDSDLKKSDPPVYYYMEGDKTPTQKWDSFTKFLHETVEEYCRNMHRNNL